MQKSQAAALTKRGRWWGTAWEPSLDSLRANFGSRKPKEKSDL